MATDDGAICDKPRPCVPGGELKTGEMGIKIYQPPKYTQCQSPEQGDI